MKNKKIDIVKRMSQEVGRDIGCLVAGAGKLSAKIFFLPFVGQLSSGTRELFYYGNNWNDWSELSGMTSLLVNIPMYSFLGYFIGNLGNSENPKLGLSVGLTTSALELAYRTAKKAFPLDQENEIPGSLMGFLPSKIIDYISRKYSSTKQKLKGGGR